MASLKYWLWLTTRKGVSNVGMLSLLNHFGTPEAAHFADPAEYDLVPGLTRVGKASLLDKSMTEAERILSECDRLGQRILTFDDAAYPERLRNIYDPPAVLYLQGRDIDFDDQVAISLIGTRDPTAYGIAQAQRLGHDLAAQGAVVVSGLARGLDSEGLRGALRGGGTVCGVLGCGLDVIYPRENEFLYRDVAAAGLLVSEYPPGTEVKGSNFPVRNRIISGLSLGVVVVESKVTGGSMLTVRHAQDQDRDVFAVPGPVDAPTSGGTNQLIRLGTAKLVERARDILEEYVDRYPGKLGKVRPLSREAVAQRLESVDRPGRPPRAKPDAGPRQDPAEKAVDTDEEVDYIVWREHSGELTDDQRDVLLALNDGKRSTDELIERTQLPARRVSSALTLLQVRGWVVETPEKRFQGKVKLKME